MRTAVIKHRVADFLRQSAPFDRMELEDLLTLADTGRVSFHQGNESICRAGDPGKAFLYVIQQGRVNLYEGDRLCDILSTGDIVGLECLLPEARYLHTARTATDVLLYALDSRTFEQIANRYPQAGRYLAAHFSARRAGSTALAPTGAGGHLLSWTSQVLPIESIVEEDPVWISANVSIEELIRLLSSTGSALAVATEGTVTLADAAIALANGRASAADPCSKIANPIATAKRGSTCGELALVLIRSGADAIAVEEEQKKRTVTAESLSRATLYDPVAGIRGIRRARSAEHLGLLRASTDNLVAAAATGPDAIEWAGQYTAERNRAIIERVLPPGVASVLWFGADARSERIGSSLPFLGLAGVATPKFDALHAGLKSCGFTANAADDEGSQAHTLNGWAGFYGNLIQDPIGQEIYTKRHYLDLGLAAGEPAFVTELRFSIQERLREHPEFIALVSIDALAKLPPLTFYENVVVDIEGGSSSHLDLEKVAVTPLVDAARALALSALNVEIVSTADRLRYAAEFYPEARQVCQEAVSAFEVVSYQSMVRGTALQPAALDKYERELLKSAFRSISALLEMLATRCGFAES